MNQTINAQMAQAQDLLRDGLAPFVENQLKIAIQQGTLKKSDLQRMSPDRIPDKKPVSQWDVSALSGIMRAAWETAFNPILGKMGQTLVHEITVWRNAWAHQEIIAPEDLHRALDSMYRLLNAISAPQAEAINEMKQTLMRELLERSAKPAATAAASASPTALPPWRDVMPPHPDVASGKFRYAEFAADLWQVYQQKRDTEYSDPEEFFRRTYLTVNLRRLLSNALRRLHNGEGDPVVRLQTSFGGGKTHSMLALYHFFSGINPRQLSGGEDITRACGAQPPKNVRRVVLVGSRISPGNPVIKQNGAEVRTLWGELAWQLGGEEAFRLIAPDDQNATNPGDRLRELFERYSPCLILIDEWVAYARQLPEKRGELPGGDFETMFSFAQALTEAATSVPQCLVVLSLPASVNDPANTPSRIEDREVGGVRGREALIRLQNVILRIESSWSPASAEESFEIVRRRLFKPIAPRKESARTNSILAFTEMYQTNQDHFPADCNTAAYRQRLEAAYPIHPEIFDQLYGAWSTLVEFHRTRGVLRLMAAVIHQLWDANDRSPLILPGLIPLSDTTVRDELTRYLGENWRSIIERDIDGENSLPARLDRDIPRLGLCQAARRAARAIFLGTAPINETAQRGLDETRITLGCAFPHDNLPVFGDALRRLINDAAYIYQENNRYWCDTQPTVTKMAKERSEQLRRRPNATADELRQRLAKEIAKPTQFHRIHLLTRDSGDIPDERETRLVILPPEHPCHNNPGQETDAAQSMALHVLEYRGQSPRIHRNALVFAAADQTLLQDLQDSIRDYLAWDSIITDKEKLNLPPTQVKQAENQRKDAESRIGQRLPETYKWLLIPSQESPTAPIFIQRQRLDSSGSLSERVYKTLTEQDKLIPALSPTSLRKELDQIPLWRNDAVSLRQLEDDYAKYIYLHRLQTPRVLWEAIRNGAASPRWRDETFAVAEDYDEANGRYKGLYAGRELPGAPTPNLLLVKAEIAREQIAQEEARRRAIPGNEAFTAACKTPDPVSACINGSPDAAPLPPAPAKLKTRYHGSVTLNPDRMGTEAGKIAQNVVAHLHSAQNANVSITLEIHATLPNGATEELLRIVGENSGSLQFTDSAFEEE